MAPTPMMLAKFFPEYTYEMPPVAPTGTPGISTPSPRERNGRRAGDARDGLVPSDLNARAHARSGIAERHSGVGATGDVAKALAGESHTEGQLRTNTSAVTIVNITGSDKSDRKRG